MTIVSNDFLAQPALRPAADKQAGNKDVTGFDDALKTSDDEPKSKTRRQSGDETRWTRFGGKLDAAIAAGHAKDLGKERAASNDDEPDISADQVGPETEASHKENQETDAMILVQPGLHFPPIQMRRATSGPSDARVAAAEETKADDATISPNAAQSKVGQRHADAQEVRGLPEGAAEPEKALLDQLAGRAAPTAGDRSEKPAEPARADAKGAAARAMVLSEQNFAAPMPSTGMLLAEKIGVETTALDVAGKTQAQAVHTQTGTASAHSLKIQLHPAELGVVTANLRLAGEQLSVEIHVENKEAYQRLNTDSETILKSLRGLGYEIDKVTILQPNIAVNSPARAESEASISNQMPRGGEAFGSDKGNGSGNQNSGGSGHDARQNNGPATLGSRGDGAGGGLYI